MENYLITSSLSLLLLYPIYKLFISYESNHHINRFAGMACVLFSITLIHFPIQQYFLDQQEPVVTYFSLSEGNAIQQTFQKVASVNSEDSINILLICYLIGMAFFLFRFLSGISKIIYLYLKAQKTRLGHFKTAIIYDNLSPFTFGRVLFIGQRTMTEKNLEMILTHEKFHKDQWHTVDTLLLEIITIIFWFNPIIWLFQRDIKAEHEYAADMMVLNSGVEPLEYQKLLFKTRTGISLPIGNGISNKTSLNIRFKKMEKHDSKSKLSYLKAALFLPLMAFFLLISAFNPISQDTTAVYTQGEKAMYKQLGNEIRYPAMSRQATNAGQVYVSFTVNKEGNIEDVVAEKLDGTLLQEIVVVGYSDQNNDSNEPGSKELKDEAVRTIHTLGKFTPAMHNGKPVSSVLILPIKFELRKK